MAFEFGTLEVFDGQKLKTYPTYCCAHCSDVVICRPDRSRPRERCLHCMGYLCEKKELCRVQCTPLHEMARDHFEGAGQNALLVPAIMQGCETVSEAQEKGLITL